MLSTALISENRKWISPQWIAHFEGLDPEAINTVVSGIDNGDTDSSIYVTTEGEVRLLLFGHEFHGNAFNEDLGFILEESH